MKVLSNFKKGDVILGLCFLALSVFVFWETQDYPFSPLDKGGGAGLYPRILAAAMGVLSIIVVARGWFKTAQTSASLSPKIGLLYISIFTLFSMVTPYTYQYLGFLLATFIFLALMILLLRTTLGKITFRSLLLTLFVSAGFTYIVFVTFRYGAKVPLPPGTLFGG